MMTTRLYKAFSKTKSVKLSLITNLRDQKRTRFGFLMLSRILFFPPVFPVLVSCIFLVFFFGISGCTSFVILLRVSLVAGSVSDDYLDYMLWQFPTNVTGWICNVLVTSSLLKACPSEFLIYYCLCLILAINC